MFDFSFPEMVVVFVVGLLVLGPERLPKMARNVGLWVGRARAMFGQVRAELEREANFQELKEAERELRQSLEDGRKAVVEPPAEQPAAPKAGAGADNDKQDVVR